MPGSTRPPHRGPPPEQPSFSAPDEGEPVKKGEEGKARTLSRFLEWLGKVLVEEAKVEGWNTSQPPPLTLLHEVSLRQRRSEEVVAVAEKVCNDLEEAKRKLTSEFGASASTFISKCIDPMIDHARRLILDLSSSSVSNGSFPDLLAQAIESVELYSQFSDETKIKRKIVQDAQTLIHQTIEKDMMVLANYKRDALASLQQLTPQERKEREMVLDRFLYPIMRELKGMASSHVETDDLHAFFVWKTNVDDRRDFLVELGMSTAETLTGQKTTIIVEVSKELETDENELMEINALHEEHSDRLSRLSNLEDRTVKLLALLKNAPIIDRASIKLIDQLFTDLKNDIESFSAHGADSERVHIDFQQVVEKLEQAESIIQNHKKS